MNTFTFLAAISDMRNKMYLYFPYFLLLGPNCSHLRTDYDRLKGDADLGTIVI